MVTEARDACCKWENEEDTALGNALDECHAVQNLWSVWTSWDEAEGQVGIIFALCFIWA